MCVFINRQFPILPGRLQPSTFGLYVLNYCVRNGNRWNHVGNITGFVERLLFQNYTEESCLNILVKSKYWQTIFGSLASGSRLAVHLRLFRLDSRNAIA